MDIIFINLNLQQHLLYARIQPEKVCDGKLLISRLQAFFGAIFSSL